MADVETAALDAEREVDGNQETASLVNMKSSCNEKKTRFKTDGVFPSATHAHARFFVRWGFRFLVSLLAHIGVVVCLSVIVWLSRARGIDQSASGAAAVVVAVLAVLMYAVVLGEAFFCTTLAFLKTYRQSTTFNSYLQSIRDTQPTIRWASTSYHYDESVGSAALLRRCCRPCVARRRLMAGGGGSATGSASQRLRGWLHSATGRRETQHAAETLEYSRATDLSRDDLHHPKALVLAECSKIFIFKDDSSRIEYARKYAEFRERNRDHDQFMDHSEEMELEGFKEKIMAPVCSDNKSCWINSFCFWLSTLLLFTWLYRLAVKLVSTKCYIVFIKEIEL